MHITILAIGTRGDVQPYIALGKALRAADHGVRVGTLENFEPLVTQQGLEFHPIPGNAQAILGSEAVVDLVEPRDGNAVRNLLEVGRAWIAFMKSCAGELWDATRGTEVVISQLPGSLFGFDIAEKLRVPYVMTSVIPLLRTRAFPIPLLPPASLGGSYNLLTYRAVELIANQMFRSTIDRWRQETLGLPKAPFWGHWAELREKRVPMLHGFSPRVVPRPRDWPEHAFVTGYWFLDDEDWQPPSQLVDFLDAGPAPVVVGFGSMPVRDGRRMTDTIVQALQKSGQRGVLVAGWAGIGQCDLPDEVLRIEYAPYSWLFPRAAAVVHHGGSGSTAAGLRAGVPSIVVPFLLDQFFWGWRVVELGVGPAPIPRRELSADRLAATIHTATSDRGIRTRATTLGTDIRNENGLTTAVAIIERYMSEAHLPVAGSSST